MMRAVEPSALAKTVIGDDVDGGSPSLKPRSAAPVVRPTSSVTAVGMLASMVGVYSSRPAPNSLRRARRMVPERAVFTSAIRSSTEPLVSVSALRIVTVVAEASAGLSVSETSLERRPDSTGAFASPRAIGEVGPTSNRTPKPIPTGTLTVRVAGESKPSRPSGATPNCTAGVAVTDSVLDADTCSDTVPTAAS